MLTFRPACVQDVEACSDVLCRSIRELCEPDHEGDSRRIERWTRNKTPESIASWITESRGMLYVAVLDDEIVAVGGIDNGTSITVNYVSPDFRFQGVSREMLAFLEDQLRRKGVRVATLSSSRTAHQFYKSAGWKDTGETELFLGWEVPLMTKNLSGRPAN